jgi:hypothetical protein
MISDNDDGVGDHVTHRLDTGGPAGPLAPPSGVLTREFDYGD